MISLGVVAKQVPANRDTRCIGGCVGIWASPDRGVELLRHDESIRGADRLGCLDRLR
jgi:hypothetical protein